MIGLGKMSGFNKYVKGQGMVGLLIASTFVLVPMAIAIPYLAKVSDSKHKLYEASRYSAWERTVYDRTGSRYNRKSDASVMREINQRVFGLANNPVDTIKDKQNVTVNTINLDPMLKTYNYGNGGSEIPMLRDVNQATNSYNRINMVERAQNGRIGRAVDGVARRGLRLERSGIQIHDVTIELAKISTLPLMNGRFESTSRNAILNGAWNANGPADVRNSLRNVISSRILQNGIVSGIQRLGSAVGFKDVGTNSLQFGRVDPDRVACQRLVGARTNRC